MRSLAYVLLIAVSWATDLVSDLVLRPRHIAGTDPGSWDTITSIFSGIAMALLVAEHWRKPPVPSTPKPPKPPTIDERIQLAQIEDYLNQHKP